MDVSDCFREGQHWVSGRTLLVGRINENARSLARGAVLGRHIAPPKSDEIVSPESLFSSGRTFILETYAMKFIRKLFRPPFFLVAFIFLGACATGRSPEPYQTRLYTAGYDEVWLAALKALNDYPLKISNKDSGKIESEVVNGPYNDLLFVYPEQIELPERYRYSLRLVSPSSCRTIIKRSPEFASSRTWKDSTTFIPGGWRIHRTDWKRNCSFIE